MSKLRGNIFVSVAKTTGMARVSHSTAEPRSERKLIIGSSDLYGLHVAGHGRGAGAGLEVRLGVVLSGRSVGGGEVIDGVHLRDRAEGHGDEREEK